MATATFGSNTGNAGSTDDCVLNHFFATTNINTADLEMQNTGNADPNHALLKFTMTSLSGPVTVSAAQLFIKKTGENPSFYTPTINVYRLRRAFNEAQATWTVYTTGNNWGTAGALNTSTDIVATPVGTEATFGEASGAYHAIDMDPADVQDCINNPSTNHGWQLRVTTAAAGTGPDYWRAGSSEEADGDRPYLVVTYTAGGSGGTGGTGGKLTGGILTNGSLIG